ncbi:hypothetical protein [Curtobacterium sp. MCBD17_030]|uniref:hypothetical protein n=1 Tax=Curtobacterium sp. MCBD17_030 TaxID=2175649 RepID=UPI0015E8AF59|nr:hypothetical protein [Curtobacterium sp. MCBD17_030]
MSRLILDSFVVNARDPGKEVDLVDASTREFDVTWRVEQERIVAFRGAHQNRG